MTAGEANKGRAPHSLLKWTLVLLVIANIAVWAAWPLKDKLVAMGVLMPPPAERVDLAPRPLPPILEGVESDLVVDPGNATLVGPKPETEGTEPAAPPPPDTPPVVRESDGAEAAPTSVAVSPAVLDCVVVGPFPSRDAMESEQTRFRSAGAQVEALEETGAGRPGYFVYVAPADSPAAADSILSELEAQMIKDARVIWEEGPYQNAVSVGFFHNHDLAVARRDRVAELGFAVQMRTSGGSAHRLRLRQVSPAALADLDYEPCVEETP
ncbi:MAG: hypothetical protein OXK76_14595 [Gammaproteobacteria bacterium]|nr:hypothetical protein [Gammaproteobacteria bacterium]